MNKRDVARFIKIDAEMIEVEYEYNKALEYEQETGKKTLLRSKTLKYKYSQLQRMRANLERSVSGRISRTQTYSAMLEDRKIAVLEAQAEVDYIENNIAQLGARALVMPKNLEIQLEFGVQRAALRSAKIILGNKERAVMNWLRKSEQSLPIPRIDRMKSNYGKWKEELKEKVKAQDNRDDIDFTLRVEPVEINPNVTNVPFDLLASSPKYDVIDEIPDSAIEPTVEELETRQLEEMHETKYQPPMID